MTKKVLSNTSVFVESNLGKLIEWVWNNPSYEMTALESIRHTVNVMWAIHAPHDLRFLKSVLKQLPSVFRASHEILSDRQKTQLLSYEVDLEGMTRLCEHLLESEGDLHELFGNHIYVPETQGNTHPMHKSIGRYYAYAGLMVTQESKIDITSEMFIRLQAAVLNCHILSMLPTFLPAEYLIQPCKSNYQFEGSQGGQTTKAFRFVRTCSYNKDEEDLNEIGYITSMNSLAVKLDNQDTDVSDAKKALMPLFNSVLYEAEEQSPKRPYTRRIKRRRFKGWVNGYIEYDSGLSVEETEVTGVKVRTISSKIKDTGQDWIDSGLDPSENTPPEEVILVGDDNPGSVRLISRNQVRHIEMANQRLKVQWENSSVYEVTELINKCNRIIYCDNEGVDKIASETACLILMMLFTGSTLERLVTKFRWINGKQDVLKGYIVYQCADNEKSGQWILNPLTIDQNININKTQRSYCEKKSAFMYLPDISNIGDCLISVFGRKDLERINKRIFNKKVSTYRKSLSEITKSLSEGNRINESRISRYLFTQIENETNGDIAEAILITSRYQPLGKTLLHYSSMRISYLQDIYERTVQSMVKGFHKEGYVNPNPIVMPYTKTDSLVVGSAYCPTEKAVKNAISSLKSLCRINLGNTNLSSVVGFHNIYTLYTVLMVGYCTGYRAIKDPFPIAPDIDEETGFVVISDKDGEDFYNSRLVWIPQKLKEQLSNYREHRQSILSYLVLTSKRDLDIQLIPELFLLDELGQVIEVRPKNLKPLLENILPLPINSNRRYLRTHLRQSGCPAEIVDAFMGHWSRGQEPWGRYSSLSMTASIEVLKPYLLNIVDGVGFEVIRSRFYGY